MTETEKTSGRRAPAKKEGSDRKAATETTEYTHGGGWIPGLVVLGLIALAIVIALLT